MTLLLQVSDPHFGTERAPVVEALQALVHEQRPDVLVLSGDLTQRARPEQFAAARDFVQRLQVPVVLAIPGNHDIPLFNLAVRLLRPYARFQKAFGNNLEPCHRSPSLLVVTVKTTRRLRHIDGQVDFAQVERVAALLQQAPPQAWRIVVVHQPVAVTKPGELHNLLHGHDPAVRRWAEAGADIVMGGHIHLPYVLPLHEHFKGLARPMWAVQAGTALSHRVRAGVPNSVNLLRIMPGAGAALRPMLRVERWDHAAATQKFQQVDVHTLGDGPAAPR